MQGAKLDTIFTSIGQEEILFLSTDRVRPGIRCDNYTFPGAPEKDLGVVYMAPGTTTPFQLVRYGGSTLEIPMEGAGRLVVKREDGQVDIFVFDSTERASYFEAEIRVGDIMVWYADKKSGLAFYELCSDPPYRDGRFDELDPADPRVVSMLSFLRKEA